MRAVAGRNTVVPFPKKTRCITRKHNQPPVGWHKVMIDPDVLEFRHCYAATNMTKKAIANKSGVSLSTIDRWLDSSAPRCRPLGVTMRFVMNAMGWSRPKGWQKE